MKRFGASEEAWVARDQQAGWCNPSQGPRERTQSLSSTGCPLTLGKRVTPFNLQDNANTAYHALGIRQAFQKWSLFLLVLSIRLEFSISKMSTGT